MAYTWGSTDLKIVPQTYKAWHCDNGLVVIDLLPDGTDAPASIIQQGGRSRKLVAFDGFVSTIAAYNSLLDDFIALTERTFSDPAGSMLMIISELTPPTMIIDNKWDYSIVLMEA